MSASQAIAVSPVPGMLDLQGASPPKPEGARGFADMLSEAEVRSGNTAKARGDAVKASERSRADSALPRGGETLPSEAPDHQAVGEQRAGDEQAGPESDQAVSLSQSTPASVAAVMPAQQDAVPLPEANLRLSASLVPESSAANLEQIAGPGGKPKTTAADSALAGIESVPLEQGLLAADGLAMQQEGGVQGSILGAFGLEGVSATVGHPAMALQADKRQSGAAALSATSWSGSGLPVGWSGQPSVLDLSLPGQQALAPAGVMISDPATLAAAGLNANGTPAAGSGLPAGGTALAGQPTLLDGEGAPFGQPLQNLRTVVEQGQGSDVLQRVLDASSADAGDEAGESSLTRSFAERLGAMSTSQQLTGAAKPNGSPPQFSLPQPFGAPDWGRGVGERVVWMMNQRVGSAELQLDPPELGALSVRVVVQQEQASLSFSSPHASVREALEQQLPRLRELLAESGIQLDQASVSDQSSSDRHASPGSQGQLAEESQESLSSDDHTGAMVHARSGLVDFYA